MSRVRRLASGIAAGLGWPFATAWSWWSGLEPLERVLYRGLVLLSAGLGIVWLPAVLILPGLILTLMALGFDLHRGAR